LQASVLDPSKGNIYQATFSPPSKGYTRDTYFDVDHDVQVEVVAADSYASSLRQVFDRTSEPIGLELEILQPPPDYTLQIDESTTMPVTIFAAQYEWACRKGSTCGDGARPPAAIQVLLDDRPVVSIDPERHTQHHYQVDLPVSPSDSSPRTLRVEATDDDRGTHSVEQRFSIVRAPPQLSITRDVVQTGSFFDVTLTIANDPDSFDTASVDYVVDHYEGFQAVGKETSRYGVTPEYDRQTGRGTVRLDFAGSQGCVNIAPGAQAQVNYELVPVLYEGSATRSIGEYNLKLKLLDQWETEFPIGIHEMANWSADAIDDADYVIVTNPDRLHSHAWDSGAVNTVDDLLAEMAHLAVLRNGVLGYLSIADDPTVLDGLVSTNGEWTVQLHPDFAAPGLGYMLLVGESDVVPAWHTDDFRIELSDQPYSDRPWSYSGAAPSDGPSLIVGRAVGDSCSALLRPLQTSIRVAEGLSGYGIDRSV
jgi:hypothetical protein